MKNFTELFEAQNNASQCVFCAASVTESSLDGSTADQLLARARQIICEAKPIKENKVIF